MSDMDLNHLVHVEMVSNKTCKGKYQKAEKGEKWQTNQRWEEHVFKKINTI